MVLYIYYNLKINFNYRLKYIKHVSFILPVFNSYTVSVFTVSGVVVNKKKKIQLSTSLGRTEGFKTMPVT